MQCSNSCFIIGFIYVDRILFNCSSLHLNRLNMHRYILNFSDRLSLVSVLLAIKYNDDVYFGNRHYARVGGISLEELNRLERKTISLLNYNLHINSDTYTKYLRLIYKSSLNSLKTNLKEVEEKHFLMLTS
jgi:hypothetical protein